MKKIANSMRILAFAAVSLLLVAALTYSIAEHRSLLDSVWWALMTATTVATATRIRTPLTAFIMSANPRGLGVWRGPRWQSALEGRAFAPPRDDEPFSFLHPPPV
jgi:hypothetical protein